MRALAPTAESCPLGLMLSNDRRIGWCNPRFAGLFGHTGAELLGQVLAMLYPSPGEYQRIGDRGHAVMRERGEYRDDRLMRRRDGIVVWFRVRGRAEGCDHPDKPRRRAGSPRTDLHRPVRHR